MSLPLSFVCFLWRTPGYRSQFAPAHVNALLRMVNLHYRPEHRFICVTNESEGFDQGVELVPDNEDFARLSSPHGGSNPSCYRRLRLFAPNAGLYFGPRIAALDLDCVAVADLEPLFDRPEDFIIWRDPGKRTPYCGSMMLLTAGARPHVWTTFNPATSPREALRAGFMGSDQAWIARCLGPNERTWNGSDGVYSYRMHLADGSKTLPANARIVFFHGRFDPWGAHAQTLAWVREHWGVA